MSTMGGFVLINDTETIILEVSKISASKMFIIGTTNSNAESG